MNQLSPKRILKTDAMNEISPGLPSPGGIVGNLQTLANIDILEIDPTKVARAREMLGKTATVRLGSISWMPYRDGIFDLIIDASTLDHVPQERLEQTLFEYWRVLRVGGHAAIMVWSTGNVAPYVTNNEHTWTPDYTCYFADSVLEKAIADRFEVVERQRFYEDDHGVMTYFLVKKESE